MLFPFLMKGKMKTQFYNSEYKGVASVVLENEKIRATWLPSYGSKLASLIAKNQSGEQELLFQSDLTELIIPSYGAVFSDYDSSGFDECFPTIDSCEWNHQNMPDHGEVWAMPWHCEQLLNGSLTFSVYSEKFNYTFSKNITLDDDSLISTYQVQLHKSVLSLPFIWTPHALFRGTATTQFIIPEYMDKIYNVCGGGRLGPYGCVYDYPIAIKQAMLDLRYLEPKSANNCEKYYFTKKLCANSLFGFNDNNIEVRMSVDHHIVPYLGIWKNQGAYKGHYNFAIEPCTGIYDDTAHAYDSKLCQVVEPNSSIEWNFSIKIKA